MRVGVVSSAEEKRGEIESDTIREAEIEAIERRKGDFFII